MPAFLAPILTWIFREIIIKFTIMGTVYLVITILFPIMLDKVGGFLGVNILTTAFNSLPPGAWYFLDFARLDVGLPNILTVAVTLFILRRVPFLNVK